MFILTPYKLSFLNLGLFSLWLGWFLKFKPRLSLAIIILSILPILSFFRNTDFNGGMIQNAAFSASFYQSLTEGNLIPRWAEKLDTQFGYPAFLYMYTLPLYISALFHTLQFSFVDSTKLVFVSTYILSGIWMWKWAKLKFTSWPAMAATVAYLFVPYRFVNIHFRLDLGESVAVSLLPLVFYYLEKSNHIGIVLITLFLILAHPAISVSAIYLIFAYLVLKKQYKNILYVIFGIVLASYYWLPFLVESQYSHTKDYTQTIEFFPWHNFVYSPYRAGLLFQGGEGKMVFPVGYTIIAITILGLVKIREINKRVRFWLWAFLTIGLMLMPVSKPLWEILPFLNNFQFNYRFMGIMTVVTAMITGYFWQNIKKGQVLWIIIFIIISVGSTILNWGNRESRPYSMPDFELTRLLPYQSRMWGTGFPQALPRWTDISNLWGPEKISGPVEILSGTGKISQKFRNSTKHEYIIMAETDMVIKENTFYYPGWKLYVDDQESRIFYENTTEPGVMEFQVTPGVHRAKLVFGETPIRKMSFIISSLTAIGLLGYGALKLLGKNNQVVSSK